VTHRVAIEEIVLDAEAIPRLAAYCDRKGWRRLLLVMDVNTEAALGRHAAAELRRSGLEVDELCFPQASGLIADRDAVSKVRGRLREESFEAPVAVGAGVITDVVRYAAHLRDADFVSVPTAASMDGYASSVAAMEFDGVKVTYRARPPLAIFADPEVLARAPAELTRSGLGDMLGKATARVDWLAAHLLYGEPFCEAVDARVAGPFRRTLKLADSALAGEPGAIEALMRGLLESGVAMAMIGNSRPASGAEHHASHFWDLLAARGLRFHAPHGLQVGYATHFAMRLQRFAYGGGIGSLRTPGDAAGLDPGALEWLGSPPPPEVDRAVAAKRSYFDAGSASWPDPESWDPLRGRIADACSPFPAVEETLRSAAIPAEPGFLGVDAGTLLATFRYSNLLRPRYTVVDFLLGQGALDAALAQTLGAATSGPAHAAG
jgi:glycerol-1-phosphate dehydrogenase [NAD(P)+]